MAKLRIVIADDNDVMRKEMVVLLCMDYEIVGAVSNSELVKTATCAQPDVIVCDISPPDMNGLAARNKLVSEGKIFPFVFVADESTEEIIKVLGKERSFAFVLRDEISMHLVNAIEAVHNFATNDSLSYRNLFDHVLEDQNVVFIEEETLRKAERLVLSCEACSSGAETPFSQILDRLTGSDPSVTGYILQKPGCCPRCLGVITEETFVEVEDRE